VLGIGRGALPSLREVFLGVGSDDWGAVGVQAAEGERCALEKADTLHGRIEELGDRFNTLRKFDFVFFVLDLNGIKLRGRLGTAE